MGTKTWQVEQVDKGGKERRWDAQAGQAGQAGQVSSCYLYMVTYPCVPMHVYLCISTYTFLIWC